MPYILTVKSLDPCERHFDTVGQAITFYDGLKLSEGTAVHFDANLQNPTQGTHVDLYPGITIQSAIQELESVWEWAQEDRTESPACIERTVSSEAQQRLMTELLELTDAA